MTEMPLMKLRRILAEIEEEQKNIDENYPKCERLISPEQYYTLINAAQCHYDRCQEEID